MYTSYGKSFIQFLPFEIRSVDNIDNFKSSLKTHLFKLAYDVM